MAENSKIEWTDHTFNPWIGCTKVSPGCDHCYAEARMDTRLHRVQWGAGAPRVRTKDWSGPYRWNDQHEAFYAQHGRRQRVFCASLADVFDNQVDPSWRADLFFLIEQTPNLDWLLLTKRIGNVMPMVKEASETLAMVHKPLAWPLPNVWLGATIVNQEEADRDIPKLLATPARVRFLSMEPLLGPVDLVRWIGVDGGRVFPLAPYNDGIGWVIVGGESGPDARDFNIDWARSIVQQCQAAGVPVMVKQMGARPVWTTEDDSEPPHFGRIKFVDKKGGDWTEWPADLRVRQFPETAP